MDISTNKSKMRWKPHPTWRKYMQHLDPDSLTKSQERHFRERKNAQEQRAMKAYEAAGWTIITRGMPCFMAKKPGEWMRIVWVEPIGGFRKVQETMQALFKNLGLNVKVVLTKQEPACEPNEGLPYFCPKCNQPMRKD